MAMNIKNAETHELAKRLAKVMGSSITEAITDAIKVRLAQLDDREARIKRILAIAGDCASRISPETKAINHADLLYDEMGLPK